MIAGLLCLAPALAFGAGPESEEKPRGDPAARLLTGGSASEYWDVTAFFESGHFLFVRFLITNEGPGERTGVAIGHIVLPDGAVTDFQFGRKEGRWAISPDGLAVKVSSSVLDLHEPERRLELDSNKRGIKIAIRFPVRGAPLWSDEPEALEQRFDVVQMPVAAAGTFWMRGMAETIDVRGTIAVTHAWMERFEAEIVRRRVEVFARQQDVVLYLVDFERPGGENWRWLAIARDGHLVWRAEDFPLGVDRPATSTAEAGYPLPGRLHVRKDGLTAEVRVLDELVRTNPLNVIPQPFRFLLALKSNPRRVWARAQLGLSLPAAGDRTALKIDGPGVVAVNYLNPLPH